ncbi:alpha/beta hydrolase family esterase [Streptomyces thermocoprophilus]|uniref:Alpha/beta hydrolase family esterase n=2 Tax=Streptomyces TaxID=1883 RepID=A0ABV5VGU1_9ACTN
MTSSPGRPPAPAARTTATASATGQDPAEVRETLHVQGRPRTMTVLQVLHRPTDHPHATPDESPTAPPTTTPDAGPGTAAPAPVVLLLHGSNQTGEKLRAFTGRAFDRLATAHGAVVAYLDGHKGHWNDARVSNAFAARTEGYDDVAFVRAAVERLVERYGGDPARVHAVGYSNGGQMVIRLVHEIPDLLAGAAVLSATQPAPENFAPHETRDRPVPVMFVHGTKDPLVPYAGGMASMWGFRPRGLGLSAPETARYYARRNGITAPPATETVPTGTPAGRRARTSVEATRYGEPGRAPVVLYTVHGGGHTVPGTRRAPFLMGRTDLGFDTVAATAAFFRLPGDRAGRPARS